MTALASFDSEGQWLQASVCERAACPASSALGVRWGRAFDPSSTPSTDLAPSLQAVKALLGPCTLERFRPTPEMVSGARSGLDFGHHELVSEAAGACLVLEGQVLLWVRTTEGHTGLLLEAGEWAYLPAGVAHAVDTGRQPGLELLHLGAGSRGWFPQWTDRRLPDHLPSIDGFVDHLLDQLGEEPVQPGD